MACRPTRWTTLRVTSLVVYHLGKFLGIYSPVLLKRDLDLNKLKKNNKSIHILKQGQLKKTKFDRIFICTSSIIFSSYFRKHLIILGKFIYPG